MIETTERKCKAGAAILIAVALVATAGCRSQQQGRVKSPFEADRVGSHNAGAEIYYPLVDAAVGRLLHQAGSVQMTSYQGAPAPQTICFVGLRNEGVEELGGFRADMEQRIETQIVNSQAFTTLSRMYVNTALQELRLRPDQLLLPANQRSFLALMEREGQPVDYFLVAKITSTNTQVNRDAQRDYGLTLELIDVRTGQIVAQDMETLSKDYNRSARAKVSGFFGG